MSQIEPSKIYRIEMSGSEIQPAEVFELEQDWYECTFMCDEDSTRVAFAATMTPYLDNLKSRATPLTVLLAPGTKVWVKAQTSSVLKVIRTQSPWAMMLGAICQIGKR